MFECLQLLVKRKKEKTVILYLLWKPVLFIKSATLRKTHFNLHIYAMTVATEKIIM